MRIGAWKSRHNGNYQKKGQNNYACIGRFKENKIMPMGGDIKVKIWLKLCLYGANKEKLFEPSGGD